MPLNIFAFDISPTKIMCFDAHKVWYVHTSPENVIPLSRTSPSNPDRFLEAQLKGCPVAGQGFCGPSSASLVLTFSCVKNIVIKLRSCRKQGFGRRQVGIFLVIKIYEIDWPRGNSKIR